MVRARVELLSLQQRRPLIFIRAFVSSFCFYAKTTRDNLWDCPLGGPGASARERPRFTAHMEVLVSSLFSATLPRNAPSSRVIRVSGNFLFSSIDSLVSPP
jgi:hypothetical protein